MKVQEIRRFILVVVFLAILIGIGTLAGKYAPVKDTGSEVATSTSSTQVKAAKNIAYDGVADKSVYELLKNGHKVTTQDTSSGVFVTSIDGVENTDTSFWLYYVNGQAGTVSSDQYKLKANDKVEWRYESFE